MKLPVCLALALLLLATAPALGAEFAVTDASGLVTALDTAETNGEDNVILLAAGTYQGNFVYWSSMEWSLAIRGAEGTTREEVVLDGGGAGRVLGITTSPFSSTRQFSVEVRGLTIENGDVSSDGRPSGGGLTIAASGASIRVIDCVVHHCLALEYGGGMYLYNSSDVRVERCFVHDNSASSSVRDPGRGGGIALSAPGGTWNVVGCVVAANSAEDEGGGLWIGWGDSGTRNIVNNTVYGNSAPVGAGMYFYAAYIANVMNNWVGENTPDAGGQIAFRDEHVRNRVGYNNSVGTVVGDWTEFGGNVELSPGFRDARSLDFELASRSLLRDKGRNDAPGQIHIDHVGEYRFSDGDRDGEPIVDIGAFEYRTNRLGTLGTEPVLAGVGFGEKKPKLYLLYEKKPGKLKASALKVLTFTDGRLEALFKKKMPPGSYPIFCRPKAKGALPISLGSFIVMEPQIGEASPKEGPPGTLITLSGEWFGNKKPKVYLVNPTSMKRKKVRVKWAEMDTTQGYSELQFIVPKLASNKYILRVKNKIDEDETSFVVTE